MKKMFLVLLMIFALSGMVFADPPLQDGNVNVGSGNTANGQGGVVSVFSPSATGGAGGAGGSATIQPGAIVNSQVGGTFSPTFAPTNAPVNNNNVTATGGSVKDSGNSSNLNINAPSAEATIQKGAVVNNNNPTNTNNVTVKPNIDTTTNIGNGIGNFSPSAKVDNKVTVDPTLVNKQQQQMQQKQQITNSGNSTNTVSPVITANPTNTVSPVISPVITANPVNNNGQTISPTQEVTFNAPKIPKTVAVETSPQVNSTSELNYIDPEEHDVTREFPKFSGGIKMVGLADEILDELYSDPDVQFKGLYKAILSGMKDKKVTPVNPANVRYQIWGQKSARTRQAGIGVGGNGSGVVQSTGLGGTMTLGFSQGSSTSKKKFTIKILLVQTPEKERKANIERYDQLHAGIKGQTIVLYDASK